MSNFLLFALLILITTTYCEDVFSPYGPPPRRNSDLNFQDEQRSTQRSPKWSHFFIMHEPGSQEKEKAKGFFYQVGGGPSVVNRFQSAIPPSEGQPLPSAFPVNPNNPENFYHGPNIQNRREFTSPFVRPGANVKSPEPRYFAPLNPNGPNIRNRPLFSRPKNSQNPGELFVKESERPNARHSNDFGDPQLSHEIETPVKEFEIPEPVLKPPEVIQNYPPESASDKQPPKNNVLQTPGVKRLRLRRPSLSPSTVSNGLNRKRRPFNSIVNDTTSTIELHSKPLAERNHQTTGNQNVLQPPQISQPLAKLTPSHQALLERRNTGDQNNAHEDYVRPRTNGFQRPRYYLKPKERVPVSSHATVLNRSFPTNLQLHNTENLTERPNDDSGKNLPATVAKSSHSRSILTSTDGTNDSPTDGYTKTESPSEQQPIPGQRKFRIRRPIASHSVSIKRPINRRTRIQKPQNLTNANESDAKDYVLYETQNPDIRRVPVVELARDSPQTLHPISRTKSDTRETFSRVTTLDSDAKFRPLSQNTSRTNNYGIRITAPVKTTNKVIIRPRPAFLDSREHVNPREGVLAVPEISRVPSLKDPREQIIPHFEPTENEHIALNLEPIEILRENGPIDSIHRRPISFAQPARHVPGFSSHKSLDEVLYQNPSISGQSLTGKAVSNGNSQNIPPGTILDEMRPLNVPRHTYNTNPNIVLKAPFNQNRYFNLGVNSNHNNIGRPDTRFNPVLVQSRNPLNLHTNPPHNNILPQKMKDDDSSHSISELNSKILGGQKESNVELQIPNIANIDTEQSGDSVKIDLSANGTTKLVESSEKYTSQTVHSRATITTLPPPMTVSTQSGPVQSIAPINTLEKERQEEIIHVKILQPKYPSYLDSPPSHQINVPSSQNIEQSGFVHTQLQLPPLNFRFQLTPVRDHDNVSTVSNNSPQTSFQPLHILPNDHYQPPLPYQPPPPYQQLSPYSHQTHYQPVSPYQLPIPYQQPYYEDPYSVSMSNFPGRNNQQTPYRVPLNYGQGRGPIANHPNTNQFPHPQSEHSWQFNQHPSNVGDSPSSSNQPLNGNADNDEENFKKSQRINTANIDKVPVPARAKLPKLVARDDIVTDEDAITDHSPNMSPKENFQNHGMHRPTVTIISTTGGSMHALVTDNRADIKIEQFDSISSRSAGGRGDSDSLSKHDPTISKPTNANEDDVSRVIIARDKSSQIEEGEAEDSGITTLKSLPKITTISQITSAFQQPTSIDGTFTPSLALESDSAASLSAIKEETSVVPPIFITADVAPSVTATGGSVTIPPTILTTKDSPTSETTTITATSETTTITTASEIAVITSAAETTTITTTDPAAETTTINTTDPAAETISTVLVPKTIITSTVPTTITTVDVPTTTAKPAIITTTTPSTTATSTDSPITATIDSSSIIFTNQPVTQSVSTSPDWENVSMISVLVPSLPDTTSAEKETIGRLILPDELSVLIFTEVPISRKLINVVDIKKESDFNDSEIVEVITRKVKKIKEISEDAFTTSIPNNVSDFEGIKLDIASGNTVVIPISETTTNLDTSDDSRAPERNVEVSEVFVRTEENAEVAVIVSITNTSVNSDSTQTIADKATELVESTIGSIEDSPIKSNPLVIVSNLTEGSEIQKDKKIASTLTVEQYSDIETVEVSTVAEGVSELPVDVVTGVKEVNDIVSNLPIDTDTDVGPADDDVSELPVDVVTGMKAANEKVSNLSIVTVTGVKPVDIGVLELPLDTVKDLEPVVTDKNVEPVHIVKDMKLVDEANKVSATILDITTFNVGETTEVSNDEGPKISETSEQSPTRSIVIESTQIVSEPDVGASISSSDNESSTLDFHSVKADTDSLSVEESVSKEPASQTGSDISLEDIIDSDKKFDVTSDVSSTFPVNHAAEDTVADSVTATPKVPKEIVSTESPKDSTTHIRIENTLHDNKTTVDISDVQDRTLSTDSTVNTILVVSTTEQTTQTS